jgi:HlyD family secretion protein
MKKLLKITAIILVVSLAGLAVWKGALQPEKEAVALQTQQPEIGTISIKVTATGTIQPVDTVAVGTQVSGTIKTVYADFNAQVKKGQLLAEIDPSLFQATVNQYAANVDQTQSQASYQTGNFSRQRQLFELGAISRAEYEAALNQYTSAHASVKSARAQLQSARRNLAYTRIYSPIDGVVLSRKVSVGQTVAASFNTPTLFSIAKDITSMQVQARVDEADIGHVSRGQRASFMVDAFLEDEFEGRVEEVRLRPSVSANVVTYTTLISAPNEAQKLKPGMTATITIFTREEKNALLIPARALRFSPDSALAKQYRMVPYPKPEAGPQAGFVWVQAGDSLVQKKVRTGLNDNTQVQVLAGLTTRDQVVLAADGGSPAAAAAGSPASPFMPRRPGSRSARSTNAGRPAQ